MELSGLSKTECLVKAHSWLDKAIKAEEEGKSPTLIEKILDTAIKYEAAAFDGRG